jgi:centromeric protein E
MGNQLKIISTNNISEKSSRSHTVFRIELKVAEMNMQTGRSTIRLSEINLVDLAGSEGVGKTQAKGIILREGKNINKSLLALSNVIYKLGTKYKHINFRDSKLTRIL